MRLYVVGIEGFSELCNSLRERDLSVQVITDAHRTGEIACSAERPGAVLCFLPPTYANQADCDCLLKTWNKGIHSLVQVGGILNFDGANALLAVPKELCRDVGLFRLVSKLKGKCHE